MGSNAVNFDDPTRTLRPAEAAAIEAVIDTGATAWHGTTAPAGYRHAPPLL